MEIDFQKHTAMVIRQHEGNGKSKVIKSFFKKTGIRSFSSNGERTLQHYLCNIKDIIRKTNIEKCTVVVYYVDELTVQRTH